MVSLSTIIHKVTGSKPLGHGPWEDANSGWVDPQPYVQYWHPGLFEGYDGAVWKYWRFPEDVQIEWLKDDMEAVYNQHFFVQLCQQLGEMLDGQQDKTRGDVRRDFHIQITQEPVPGVRPYKGATPAHADYLRRMGQQAIKPDWSAFFGLRILPTTIFYEAYGFRAQLQRYLEMFRDPGALQWTYLKQDLDELDRVMAQHGFEALNFMDRYEDFERLTAWHGVSDMQYEMPLQLQNTRFQVPVHGKSIITPKWGEMMFHALKPSKGNDLADPLSQKSRWAEALYRPEANVVVVNIRGQIRAPKIADNLLDIKRISKQERAHDPADPTSVDIVSLIQMARAAVQEQKLPMLDNLEIIVGTTLHDEPLAEPPLTKMVRRLGMEVAPLVDRQHLGLLSTLPTYPRHVMRIPRGNKRRPELTNVMLPGMLAFSGIFRANKPCATSGVLLGLGDAGDQYQEIYTEPDGAYKNNRVPGMLVTGRPGAGKTQQLLQITSQLVYMGLPVVFFNPKKEGTLQPTFDHLGGTTLSMNRQYLDANPGMLDPVYFLDDRREVARLLADAIFMANGMYQDTGSAATQRRTLLQTEIQERAVDPRNRTSYDILLGNPAAGTTPITDPEIAQFIQNKMKISPFWQAFISVAGSGTSALQDRLAQSRALLIEWDKSMQLPDASTEKYTDTQIDTVLSISTCFAYAAAKVGGTGGAIIVDESWVLKSSKEALQILERGGREWRQANIMLILGTQRILDWMQEGGLSGTTTNMASFFDRYLFMAIAENDEAEIRKFFEMTGLPDTERNRYYITHAGVDKRRGRKGSRIPRAYYVDNVHDWAGGIVAGPWPELELNLGRTDKEGTAARDAMARTDGEASRVGSLGGALADVLEDRYELDSMGEDSEPAPESVA